MEFFKVNTTIRFMKQRTLAAIFSLIVFAGSLFAIVTEGLTLGIDFTGGTQMDVSFTQPISANEVRDNLQAAGFKQAVLQQYSAKEYSIRVGLHSDLSKTELHNQIMSVLPKGAKSGSMQYIGPQVGKQLMTNGVLAILVCLIGTMIYIALRFDYRFALSAALALIHDPVLILGVFAYFHLQFDMIVLTGLLTVIGYSLNDTIVVYDRVRENFRKLRKKTPLVVMDISINETLSRTIMTSGLTLLVVISLFVYGGDSIHGFSLALIIGIVIGTYSSIYVAGSLAIAFGLTQESLLVKPKQFDDGLP